MGKLVVVYVNQKNKDLHERLFSKDKKFIGRKEALELTKKLRELMTPETGVMINLITSDYQDSDLRQILKILKTYNFHCKHIESSISGDKKSFLAEIRESFANFAYTMAFTDYSTEEITKLIKQDLQLKSYKEVVGPSGLLCFVVNF